MNRERLFLRLVENYLKAKPNVSKDEAERHVSQLLKERDKQTNVNGAAHIAQPQRKIATTVPVTNPFFTSTNQMQATPITIPSLSLRNPIVDYKIPEIKNSVADMSPEQVSTTNSANCVESDQPFSPKSPKFHLNHTPKQIQVVASINDLHKKIAALEQSKEAGILSVDGTRRVIHLQATLRSKEQLLKRLRSEAQRQRKRRSLLKSKIAKLTEEHPELKLLSRGKMSSSNDQSHLYETLAEMEDDCVSNGASDGSHQPSTVSLMVANVGASPCLPSPMENFKSDNSDWHSDSNSSLTSRPLFNEMFGDNKDDREIKLAVLNGDESSDVIRLNMGPEGEEDKDFSSSPIDMNTNTTPKQIQVIAAMNDLHKRITALQQSQDSGTLNDAESKELSDLQADLKCNEQLLKRLRSEAERQRKRRSLLKSKIAKLAEEHPELKLLSSEKSPSPSDQPQMYETIAEMEMDSLSGSNPEDSNHQSSNLTMDNADSGEPLDLNECSSSNEMSDNVEPGCNVMDTTASRTKRGFVINRKATYLRLQSNRGQANSEGKVYVKTVPVKLLGCENEEKHVDTDFGFASYNYVNEICALFGPNNCSFMSIDDTARIALSLASSKAKAPILANMEYKVRPTYRAMLADRRKLIPSVYALCEMKSNPDSASAYSGPTYIGIRSGKHDSTNAFSHARDFKRLLELDSFKKELCDSAGAVKPILIMSVDGGPCESPRFAQTLAVGAERFHLYNLDVYISLTQAAGYSAYNTVERRLAPLSRQLCGLILPRNEYGLHIDTNGRTFDPQLEQQNFYKIGGTVAQVLSDVVMDKHSVHAEFVTPENSQWFTNIPPPEWIQVHVRQSQYMLQIVKCDNHACCGPWRTSWREVIPERFLPPPFPLKQSPEGLRVPEPQDVKSLETPFASLIQRLALRSLKPKATVVAGARFCGEIPYDLYCPSIRQNLPHRVCPTCGVYFPSSSAVQRHLPMHYSGGIKMDPQMMGQAIESEFLPDPEPFDVNINRESEECLPIIQNMVDIMRSPWTTDPSMM